MYFRSSMLVFLFALLSVMAVILFFLVSVAGEKKPAVWPTFQPDGPAAETAVREISEFSCTNGQLMITCSTDTEIKLSGRISGDWISISPDRSCIFYWQSGGGRLQLKIYSILSGTGVQYSWQPIVCSEPLFTGWAADGSYRVVVHDADPDGNVQQRLGFFRLVRNGGTGLYRSEKGREYVFPPDRKRMDFSWSLSPAASWIVIMYRFPGPGDENGDTEPMLFYSDGFSADKTLPLPGTISCIPDIRWDSESSFTLCEAGIYIKYNLPGIQTL